MSYQDYQYSWPSESYDYSYNSAQYTNTGSSQGQYASVDQYPTPAAQSDSYQYETSYAKPADPVVEYSSTYSSAVTIGSEGNMDAQYGQDQYSMPSSNYSNIPETPYPSSSSYQYSNSQASHEPPGTADLGYGNDTSYTSSYPYSEAPPSQMDTGMSNHSYGGDAMEMSYSLGGGEGSQEAHQASSYLTDYTRSAQYMDSSAPSSNTFYASEDDAGGGMYLGNTGVDGNSAFSQEYPGSNATSVMESADDLYQPEYNDTSKLPSYGSTSYSPRGQGYHSYGGRYGGQRGDRRQGHNAYPRGGPGRGNRSTFSSGRGNSSSTFGNSYSKPSQSHGDISRDGYRGGGGGGNQYANNRFANTRSRGPNSVSLSSRSRGSTGYQRGSNTTRFNSNRGGNSNFYNRGSDSGPRGGQRRGFLANPVRDGNTNDTSTTNRPIPTHNSFPARGGGTGSRLSEGSTQGQWKIQETSSNEKKEKFKAPSRPQDKLLNEIEQKEKEEQRERERKAQEEKEKAEMVRRAADEARKAEEEAQKKIMEEARRKAEEMAKKLAPPSKPPETPEEIAKEEEIQRKIRESVVVIDPVKEMALLTDDPIKDMDMPGELRELLKSLTSDSFCTLCSLRMVGPHMAPMHYNGKNHLKKVRTFVQTNGRSAGFNMDTLGSGDESAGGEKKEGETENEEEMEVDEKKYCKICKISFSHGSQYEMHYKGKNHAKKVRSLANSTEIFECKLCCVTVTAQEHLTAHLNGARHKLQLRKNNRDNIRGRGGLYGRPGRGGMGKGENGAWKPAENKLEHSEFQGRGRFDGRGRGRGRGGFKRHAADQNGQIGPFGKRPRF